MLTIVETPEFQRQVKALKITEAECTSLIDHLAQNPKVGLSLGSGLRKLRWAKPGGGKRGGYRVIYFYQTDEVPLFLLTIFGKSQKANLSSRETKELARLAQDIADHYGK